MGASPQTDHFQLLQYSRWGLPSLDERSDPGDEALQKQSSHPALAPIPREADPAHISIESQL